MQKPRWDQRDEEYHLYRNGCFQPKFKLGEFLQGYLKEQAEKSRGQMSPDLADLTHREFFNCYVVPLVKPLLSGGQRIATRKLAEIGLDSGGLSREDFVTRLNCLLQSLFDEDLLVPSLKKELNSALIEWAEEVSEFQKSPWLSVMTYLLVGWEALLFLHFSLAGPSSNLMGGNLYEHVKRLSQRTSRSERRADVEKAVNKAPFYLRSMMDALENEPFTWLAVFSKSYHVAGQLVEEPDTSDPKNRTTFLERLKRASTTHLADSTSVQQKVEEACQMFDQYANKHPEDLGRNPQGRNPESRRFCLWSCRYKEIVTKTMRVLSIPDSERDFWADLLTATLLHPLTADASTVHRWLHHIRPTEFTSEVLGDMPLLKWHNRFVRAQVAVFREVVPPVHQYATVYEKESWTLFWSEINGR